MIENTEFWCVFVCYHLHIHTGTYIQPRNWAVMTGKSQREPSGLSPLVLHGLQSGTARHHLETFIYSIYVLLHAIQAALLPFPDLKHNWPLSSLCRKFLGCFWVCFGVFLWFLVLVFWDFVLFFVHVRNIQVKQLFSRWRRGFFEAVPCSSRVQRFEVASFSPAPTAAEGLRCGMGSFCLECWALKSVPCRGQGLAGDFHLAFKTKLPAMCFLETKTKLIWLIKAIKKIIIMWLYKMKLNSCRLGAEDALIPHARVCRDHLDAVKAHCE